MEAKDRIRITNNIISLSEVTEWNKDLESELVKSNVFTLKMIERIKEKSSKSQDRARQMFTDVQRRGPKAFGQLILILIRTNNYHSAKILDPTLNIPPKANGTLNLRSKESKVWNGPLYEKSPSEDEWTLSDVLSKLEIPKVDDRIPISVKVINATKFRGPPQYNAYRIGSECRGLALIIDNERFENNVLPFREGSQIDANNLDILFEQLGFKVTLRRNQSYDQMYKEIISFANHEDHSRGDMCIVAILSHGDNGLVFSRDGRTIPTEWILRQFNNSYSDRLKGKPKFFIFQACRGDEADRGYIPKLESPKENETTSVDAKAFIGSSAVRPAVVKDPTWEDMLIAYATVPGYVANRNLFRGTWFIESICRVFMTNACDLDLRDLLDKVSQQMKHYESEFGTKQSCSYENRHFYKKLYFNPGLNFPNKNEESLRQLEDKFKDKLEFV